ncbi:MAG TPA: DNA primase [Candidatus Limnocylindria bacterium]|nr:DNA primase [Candidatus Limnocylindria bacterium]
MPGDFDLVKERVDIVQLVGERVALRKAGRAYSGLCPFHAEKTPSFSVDPDRRTFHCWGCSEKGDVFDWLMKIDGIDKAEALKVLAERVGVPLTGGRPPAERERETRLLAAHETAHFYFRQALRGTPKGKAAAEYVASRGIDEKMVEQFGVAYAPDLPDGLLAYFRKKGYADEEILSTGLVVETERGLLDRFRDRLIVPIRDARGRIIAFGGRAMRADQRGKYINSPQTMLFNKSATLYALDAAKAEARRQSEAVIVEGYFDAIACHQAGLTNVVASMGTALTEDQYRTLDDLHLERAVVAFDGDAAGQRSAEARGKELARIAQRASLRARKGTVTARTGLGVYVTVLPPDTDPDDLARTDPAQLRGLIGAAKPVLEFVIDAIANRFEGRLENPDGRRRFLAEALPILADEHDVLTRELYLGRLSRLTGLDQETLRAQVADPSNLGTIRPAPATVSSRTDAVPRAPDRKQTTSLERYLMAQLTKFPEEAVRLDLDPADLADPDHRAIFEQLRGGRSTADLPAHLAATAATLGAFAPEPGSGADPGHEIEIVALRLREENLRRRFIEVRAALARADGDVGGLDEEVSRLAHDLEEVQRSLQRSTVLRSSEQE